MTFRNRKKRNEEPIEIMLRNKIILSEECTQLKLKLHGRTERDRRDELDTTIPIVGKQFCYERETHMGNVRKQHFLQHKEKHSNNKKTYTDGSNRKVGFAAKFTDITGRKVLPKETSSPTPLRKVQKREEMRRAIYTVSLSSMLAIKNNIKLSNIKSDV